MSYLFSDPKFWLLISFIVFVILMIKPFKSMMIGGLDSKIEEIKQNIDKSLNSFTEAEEKLKDAEKETLDLSNKVDELENFKQKLIIAQCKSGGRSAQAQMFLRRLGFEKVLNLSGGILKYRGQTS